MRSAAVAAAWTAALVSACGSGGDDGDRDRLDAGPVVDAGETPGGDAGIRDGGAPGEVTIASPPGFESEEIREAAQIAPLPDGRVWVAGGVIVRSAPGGGPGLPTGNEAAEWIDPDAATVTPAPPLAQGRYAGAVTRLPDGDLLVTGGIGGPPGERGTPRATAERIDGDTFEPTLLDAEMTTARAGHLAWLVEGGPHGGRVMLLGGAAAPLSAEVFDPDADAFTPVSLMGAPEALPSRATRLPDGRVLLSGAEGDEPGDFVRCFVLDPTTMRVERTGDLGAPRQGHTATVLPNGGVLVVGGAVDGALVPGAEVWDPGTGAWSATAGAPTVTRERHAAAALGSGRVVVVGGSVGLRETTDAVEVYDPASDAFAAVADVLSVARERLQATPVASGGVLVVGGRTVLPRAEFIVPNLDLIAE